MKDVIHYLFYIFLPIIIIVGVFWYGWGDIFYKKNISLSVKEIALFNTGAFNLGIFRKNGPVFVKNFNLMHKDGGEIYIKKVYSNCDCLSVVLLNGSERLGPFSVIDEEYGRPIGLFEYGAGFLPIEVYFYPKLAPADNFVGSVYFESNKGEKDVLRLDFKAKII
jgi:hypothetical protein